ncbi:MAG: DUF1320 domain-containing protein [Magnetococcales bacterium]|nr:DUF1320 domain-containing protein [Magnetococcales bacterium]
MSGYATAADLLLWYGARELAQCAVPDDLPAIGADLMRLTIAEGDRTPFTPEEIAAADAGLAAIQAALTDAARLIDSYLATRHTLPLAADLAESSGLSRVCGALARRFLHHDQTPEEVARGYDQALAWLRDVGQGRAELRPPAVATGAGLAAFDASARVFDQETLRGFA